MILLDGRNIQALIKAISNIITKLIVHDRLLNNLNHTKIFRTFVIIVKHACSSKY